MIAIVALLLEFALLAAIRMGGRLEISNIGATLLIMLFTLCLLASISSNRRLKGLYGKALLQGYFLRLAILYFDIFGQKIYSLPNMVGDATVFYREAKAYAQALLNGMRLPGTRGVFPQVMGRLFSIIGTNRLYGQFLSMLCSIVALVFFAYTLSLLDISDTTKKRTFQLVCLLPNYAILSTAFLREAVIYAFLSMSYYCFMLWIKRKHNLYYLEAAFLVLPAAFFHSGTIAVLVGYIALLTVYDNRSEKVRIKPGNILLAAVLFIVAVVFVTSQGDTFLGKFNGAESIEDIANTSTLGRTSYARFVGNSSNPISIVVFTLPRMFFFLLSPIPGMWSSFGDIIAFFFSSMYYLVVIIKAFRYLRSRRIENRSELIALMLIAFGATFVFAWGCANAGTAARHRDKMAILYGLVYALSFPQRGREQNPDIRKPW